MDYFLTEVTIPLLGWTYKRLVDPSLDNIGHLKIDYANDKQRRQMLDHIDESISHLSRCLPKELVSEAASYLSPEAETHARHQIYHRRDVHCSLCHIPYISRTDFLTTTCSEYLSVFLGIILIVLICYATYRLGTWVHGYL